MTLGMCRASYIARHIEPQIHEVLPQRALGNLVQFVEGEVGAGAAE